MQGQRRGLTAGNDSSARGWHVADVASRWAVGVLACVVAFLLTWMLWPGFRSVIRIGPLWQAHYTIGEKVGFAAETYRAHRLTLIIIGRGSCGACRAEQDRYIRLVKDLRAGPDGAALLVTPTETTRLDLDFLTSIGLDRTHVLAVPVRLLRTTVTPTVLLVDSSGRVLFEREGPLLDSDEEQILGLTLSEIRAR